MYELIIKGSTREDLIFHAREQAKEEGQASGFSYEIEEIEISEE